MSLNRNEDLNENGERVEEVNRENPWNIYYTEEKYENGN